MPHLPERWLPALLGAVFLVSSLFLPALADAQGPPPPPRCPRGYHWEGPRGCWPNGPGIRPLCPPRMAWVHGDCRPIHAAPVPTPPPPPPARCPRGYHWAGRRGCWPNAPSLRPLCPPRMAWSHGHCRPIAPPPPPRY